MMMWGFLLWVWRILRVFFFFVNNFLDFRSKALWRKFIDFFNDNKNKWIIIAVTMSVVIFIGCILYMILSDDDMKYKTNIIRNILLGLGALIGLPFLVWQNQTSHNSLKETVKNNDRTQEAKLYIDCITQLANDDKETIRTAAVHGLHQLIKNTKDESLKEKIFNILWSFMVEHSKECLRINHKMSAIRSDTEEDKKILQDLKEQLDVKQESIEDFYPQFKIILQILAEYKHDTDEEWWKDKSMYNIWLCKIDLIHTVLKNANLQVDDLRGSYLDFADLQGANLRYVKLQGADLQCANLMYAKLQGAKLLRAKLLRAKLQGADLTSAHLQGANLIYITYDDKTKFSLAHYNSKPWTDPDTKIMYEPTQFPENFDPKAHGMIDVSEEGV